MHARAILFGYEGGLVDPAGPRLEVLSAVLAEEGVELTAGVLEACPFGPPYEDWLAAVLGRVGGGPAAALAPRLMARAAARYRSLLRERGPAWLPGAIEFAERAAGDGLDLGAVATLPRAEVTRALAGSGIADLFKVVVGAEDLDPADSRQAAYRVAASRLNSQPPLPERLIHPHEIVAIDGSADGLRAAAAAGLTTVAIGAAAGPGAASLVVASYAELDVSRPDSG